MVQQQDVDFAWPLALIVLGSMKQEGHGAATDCEEADSSISMQARIQKVTQELLFAKHL
jgi:hypothetical protein